MRIGWIVRIALHALENDAPDAVLLAFGTHDALAGAVPRRALGGP